MLESKGNIWDLLGSVHAIVVTTNGSLNINGYAVMGKGIAKECNDRYYPKFRMAKHLGSLIKESGNHVHDLAMDEGTHILSFPVKHHWADVADIELIKRSAIELVQMTNIFGWEVVAVPRPGCGNGKLKWVDVQPVLAEILDDRFSVYTY